MCSRRWKVLFGWVQQVGAQGTGMGTGQCVGKSDEGFSPSTWDSVVQSTWVESPTGLLTCIDISAQLCHLFKPFLGVCVEVPRLRSLGCPGLQTVSSGAALTWAESWRGRTGSSVGAGAGSTSGWWVEVRVKRGSRCWDPGPGSGLCPLSCQGWSTSVASGGFRLRLGTLRTQPLRIWRPQVPRTGPQQII